MHACEQALIAFCCFFLFSAHNGTEQQMDLGKGLLRLWMFLSFLWILFVFWQDRPHEAFREYHIAKKALGDDDGVYSAAEIITAAEKAEAAGDMLAAVRLMRVADDVANGPGGTFKTEERVKLDQALASLQGKCPVVPL
jgi:hypothetical protein